MAGVLCSCMLSVHNGLLVIIMLISNHKSLAEQLVACGVTAVLKKCLSLSRAETMLGIIALNHISMVHKLESKGMLSKPEQDLHQLPADPFITKIKLTFCCVHVLTESCEQLDFKDTELQMLLVSLKELTPTKEVIQTLEQLLCEDTSQLEQERHQVCAGAHRHEQGEKAPL